MTTLVTGGAGFVAATLIGQLLARGDRVLALSDLAAHRQTVAAHTATPVAEVWHLDANSDIPAGIADPSVGLRDRATCPDSGILRVGGTTMSRDTSGSASLPIGTKPFFNVFSDKYSRHACPEKPKQKLRMFRILVQFQGVQASTMGKQKSFQ